MLVKGYIAWGLIVITTFAGLAASGVKAPRGSATSGAYGTGRSSYGYSSGGGWGFGK